MKKRITPTLAYFVAIRRRQYRSAWSRERLRIKRGGIPGTPFSRDGKIVFVRVRAPTVLSVNPGNARAATVEFFNEIRKASRRFGVGLHIDFSRVQEIVPSGAVMLLAEIDRALADGTYRNQVRCDRAWNPLRDAVLNQIGIYERLGRKCETSSSDDETVKHWRHATGVVSDGKSGGTILDAYDGRFADGITKGLYEGIVEAMTNTVHHAYEGEIGRPLRHKIGRRWWMLSEEKEGRLTVALCDLGIGIPRSLPRSVSYAPALVRGLWEKLGLDAGDASALEVAIQLGETRTGAEGRGKGLSEIVKVGNLSQGGGVLISSNRGIFTCNDGDRKRSNHSHSIRGTLVHWHVPVRAEAVSDGE